MSVDQKNRADDLPAFVDAYFSHLQFAPHVPKEFHDFLKGHLNAFALVMRAQYRPPAKEESENCEYCGQWKYHTEQHCCEAMMVNP